MKLFYLLLSTVFSLSQDSFIRHLDKPPCVKCKFYMPDPNEPFESSKGKCKMFGGKDTHTGVILYEDAVSVRYDDVRCSTAGKYFQSERNMCVKRLEHMVRRTKPSLGYIWTLVSIKLYVEILLLLIQ